MPAPKPPAPRREAIPRSVQREVWQRDAGVCVECGTRQLLCFDHIVPFSRGGSNTVRNLQLLCEPCNLSKGNRI
ncbi:HNH endonuclease [Pseudomonas fluorescens]|nr:HNH endonuclease [Pseudomonas fluorescens]